MFAIACGAGAIWYAARMWLALQSPFWKRVRADVLEAYVDERRDGDGDRYYVPVVKFSYRVHGDAYVGDRLTFRVASGGSYERATDELAGIAAGSVLTAYVHPRVPAIAVLRPGVDLLDYVVLVLLVTVAIFAMGFHVE